MIHRLKTWPSHFRAVVDGRKPFELRYGGDRDFAVGDYLVLEEWDPATERYTDEALVRQVTYVLDGGRFGLLDEYVAMGITPVTDGEEQRIYDQMPDRPTPQVSVSHKGEGPGR